jgi:hypothetical protein
MGNMEGKQSNRVVILPQAFRKSLAHQILTERGTHLKTLLRSPIVADFRGKCNLNLRFDTLEALTPVLG